jgi:hypothetical protein
MKPQPLLTQTAQVGVAALPAGSSCQTPSLSLKQLQEHTWCLHNQDCVCDAFHEAIKMSVPVHSPARYDTTTSVTQQVQQLPHCLPCCMYVSSPMSRHSGRQLTTQNTSHLVVPCRLLTNCSLARLSSAACCMAAAAVRTHS